MIFLKRSSSFSLSQLSEGRKLVISLKALREWPKAEKRSAPNEKEARRSLRESRRWRSSGTKMWSMHWRTMSWSGAAGLLFWSRRTSQCEFLEKEERGGNKQGRKDAPVFAGGEHGQVKKMTKGR